MTPVLKQCEWKVLKCHLVVSLLALLQYISHTVVEVDKMIAMQGDEVQLGARIWKEKTHRSPVQTCCHLGRIYTNLYAYIFTFFINLFLLVNNVLQCTSKPQKDGMKKQNSIEKKARHWLCSQHPGSTQWFIWFMISTRSLYLGLD